MYMNQFSHRAVTKVLVLALLLAPAGIRAQGQATATPANAADLYRDILNPVLDATQVYTLREVSIDREDLHISLSDGTLAFIQAVNGRITGAIFEGQGEVLMIPPGRAERTSLALFTGSAVLEQRFSTAYFRFVDDKMMDEFRAGFRPAENAQEFIARWAQPVRDLARADALSILQALTNSGESASRFIHVRVGGSALGVFDLYLNTNAQEQISVAQASAERDTVYYNVWSSFPMRSLRGEDGVEHAMAPRFDISDYHIEAEAEPPSDLTAEAGFTLTPRTSGQRTFILELSQELKISDVRVEDKQITFIQNQAISGSVLARRGDDLIAIAFPQPLEKDKPVRLRFKYSGPVMFDAGGDLLYVGARGTWYPSAGPAFANFDLTFGYPDDWSLVATGKQVATDVKQHRRITHFVTEKPIARAGFNLGKFETAESSSAGVQIHSYAAKIVEQPLAAREARSGLHPDPAREVHQIAAQAASTVQFLSAELDPFPYSELEITQFPGLLSQSWPGLIYLSSMAFLDQDERRVAGVHDPYIELLLDKLMLTHETAHQWWGDAVDWNSYRDEWIIEALANYSALLMLEKQDPAAMKTALDYYRGQLLRDTPNGPLADAGPVTLGMRLTSSKFPNAYEPVLYGRGTWLIHMLRTMLRESSGSKDDRLFFSALKSLLAQSPNHKISTHDLELAFEKVMPASLAYEGQHNLDWFFDSWVNGTAVPHFTLENVRITPAGAKVRIRCVVRETHAANHMVTAVPVYAVNGQGHASFLAFVFVDDPSTSFSLTAPAGTKNLLLDPANTVLRR
ncbi:MAG TPA: M1 family aminopeptidase [Candidatus Angelobacter sp.]|nr:M1 family aminopeptidase [Candidatus Angelobacter sp.]